MASTCAKKQRIAEFITVRHDVRRRKRWIVWTVKIIELDGRAAIEIGALKVSKTLTRKAIHAEELKSGLFWRSSRHSNDQHWHRRIAFDIFRAAAQQHTAHAVTAMDSNHN